MKRIWQALGTLSIVAFLAVAALGAPSVSAHSAASPSAGSQTIVIPIKNPLLTNSTLNKSIPSPAQLAAQKVDARALALAEAFLAKHPLSGKIVYTYPTKGPEVSFGWSWDHVDMYLTVNDVHNIWDLVWTVGLGAAGAALCAPGVWVAVVCAVVGSVIGYIVAEAVWYYANWSCGLDIRYWYWSGSWSVYWWQCQ